MADWKVVWADLKGFEDRREVVKALRKSMREPVPKIRTDVRDRARDILPRSGGLNEWVAKSKISATVKVASRTVGLIVKGGRNSAGGRSDLRAINRGRLRAPNWGRKAKARDWHTQQVPDGYFSDPALDNAFYVEVAHIRAINRAFDQIRRG
jgi:hypothetical protein